MELKGKKAVFLGDSITQGCRVDDIKNNRYDNKMKELFSLREVVNDGISGTRFAYQTKPSENTSFDLYMAGRITRLDEDADYLIVFGGTNDYGHGDAPFGKMTDTEPTTYCGAVEYMMNKAKELYPNTTTIFLAPAHRINDGDVSVEKKDMPDAKPLANYVDVIVKKGEAHNIPVLNLFTELPIDPNNEDDYNKYTADGLHFNDLGHQAIAELVGKFIESL